MKSKYPDETAHAWDESESVHFTHARRLIFARRGWFLMNINEIQMRKKKKNKIKKKNKNKKK